MCLAVPGKVKSITGNTAVVDFGGVRKNIHIDLLPQVKAEDYILVHAGFGIGILDEEEARKTLSAWKEVYDARQDS